MDLRKTLSNNLKNLRKEKELSQDQLAGMAGVSKQLISDIERGAAWPRVETLNSIADALKTAPTELLFDDLIMMYRLKKIVHAQLSIKDKDEITDSLSGKINKLEKFERDLIEHAIDGLLDSKTEKKKSKTS